MSVRSMILQPIFLRVPHSDNDSLGTTVRFQESKAWQIGDLARALEVEVAMKTKYSRYVC